MKFLQLLIVNLTAQTKIKGSDYLLLCAIATAAYIHAYGCMSCVVVYCIGAVINGLGSYFRWRLL